MPERLFAEGAPSAELWQRYGEPAVARFESAWRMGDRPDPAKYLDGPVAVRASLAAELAACDLRNRLEAGETARVEDYFSLGNLANDPERLEGLIRAEIDLRRRVEPNLDMSEFTRRFPNRGTRLGSGTISPAVVDFSQTLHAPPPAEPFPIEFTSPTALAGSVIAGRYKLTQLLGEGGMGSVWMAEQSEPIRRKVAVKLIKPGMDSAQVLSRFEAERQALALMDHPNIAKILDGGVIASREPGPANHAAGPRDSRPFFVMELVQGIPLTRYCDQNRLSIRERIELFIPICQGVQHAHQKGIIHRDLKPDNVLVGVFDGKPVPKIIDFGVAKATGSQLIDRPTHTELGAVVGTLEYMAPEQVLADNADIDTRVDIYALGVILYELLTGRIPFSRRELLGKSMMELLRVIREVEPTTPSNKLTTSPDITDVATARRSDAARLPKLIAGDLDWIVMKCLEKDRARRYETANGLGLELHRYLNDEPVLAGPPSPGYRIHKFVRRNRHSVIAASLLALALLIGMAGTVWGLLKAQAALEESRRQTDIAKEVNEFLQRDILHQADSEQQADRGFEQDPDIRVKTALERASERIGKRFEGKPLVEAAIQLAIGQSYSGIGESKLAIPHLERSVELRASQLSDRAPETLDAENNLAIAYLYAGRFDDAIRLGERVRDGQVVLLGADHPETLNTLNNLASAYLAKKQTDKAIELFESVRNRRINSIGENDPQTLSTSINLALAYSNSGRFDDAIRLLERIVDIWASKPKGADHPQSLTAQNNLALAYREAGRTADAIRLFEEICKVRTAKVGPDHPSTLTAINNLTLAYRDAGRLDDAIELLDQVYGRQSTKLGPEHPETLRSLFNLAWARLNANRFEKALDAFQKLLEAQTRTLPNDDPQRCSSLAFVGLCQLKLGRPADAEAPLREVLEVRLKLQPDLWTTFNTMSLLGASLLGQKKYADAEPLLLKGFEGMNKQAAKIPAAYHTYLADAADRLVRLYEANGKADEASKWKREFESVRARNAPG